MCVLLLVHSQFNVNVLVIIVVYSDIHLVLSSTVGEKCFKK